MRYAILHLLPFFFILGRHTDGLALPSPRKIASFISPFLSNNDQKFQAKSNDKEADKDTLQAVKDALKVSAKTDEDWPTLGKRLAAFFLTKDKKTALSKEDTLNKRLAKIVYEKSPDFVKDTIQYSLTGKYWPIFKKRLMGAANEIAKLKKESQKREENGTAEGKIGAPQSKTIDPIVIGGNYLLNLLYGAAFASYFGPNMGLNNLFNPDYSFDYDAYEASLLEEDAALAEEEAALEEEEAELEQLIEDYDEMLAVQSTSNTSVAGAAAVNQAGHVSGQQLHSQTNLPDHVQPPQQQVPHTNIGLHHGHIHHQPPGITAGHHQGQIRVQHPQAHSGQRPVQHTQPNHAQIQQIHVVDGHPHKEILTHTGHSQVQQTHGQIQHHHAGHPSGKVQQSHAVNGDPHKQQPPKQGHTVKVNSLHPQFQNKPQVHNTHLSNNNNNHGIVHRPLEEPPTVPHASEVYKHIPMEQLLGDSLSSYVHYPGQQLQVSHIQDHPPPAYHFFKAYKPR